MVRRGVHHPKGGCLIWKGPQAPSPLYKFKFSLQVQGATGNSLLQRRLFKFEGAGGPFAPVQIQSPTTSSRSGDKSHALLQVQGTTTTPKPQRRLFEFEGAEGALFPVQIQSPTTCSSSGDKSCLTTSPKAHYHSKAPEDAL